MFLSVHLASRDSDTRRSWTFPRDQLLAYRGSISANATPRAGPSYFSSTFPVQDDTQSYRLSSADLAFHFSRSPPEACPTLRNIHPDLWVCGRPRSCLASDAFRILHELLLAPPSFP